MALPGVSCEGEPPYVLASRFPNGAICVTTEGRVEPAKSWFHPTADVSIQVGEGKGPIGVFGHYASLTLELDADLPSDVTVHAQDLLANVAVDVSGEVEIEGNRITVPGVVIERIGTAENAADDISVPGLVLKIKL